MIRTAFDGLVHGDPVDFKKWVEESLAKQSERPPTASAPKPEAPAGDLWGRSFTDRPFLFIYQLLSNFGTTFA
jgi:hypothetical protein